MRFANGIGAVLLVLALGGCGNGETPPEPTGDDLFVVSLNSDQVASLNKQSSRREHRGGHSFPATRSENK